MIHIAGIGASAGGLEAMLPMFSKLRPTGRIAYVVAQHMAHDGHSELVARLIQRESTLPVLLAADGIVVQPDTVYMIPAGKNGRIHSDILSLSDPEPSSISTPSVNVLFKSIAENSGSNSIGIMLSGAGSDGTAGCRAIKAVGGLVFVQELTETKHAGMPGAVIDAGLPDQVLSVAGIAARLAELFPGSVPMPKVATRETVTAPSESDASLTGEAVHLELELLLRQVLEATGIDFSSYKEETLLRRLEKRKSLLGVTSADAYQSLIRRQPDELHTLQHLFLVSMSSFFRDKEAFDVLQQELGSLVTAKAEGEAVQVWVPGCASGEEPYTLAIILHELQAASMRKHPLKIVASDLNPEALELARNGLYRQTAFKEMPLALRERWFIARGQHFEVRQELKEAVLFEQLDLLNGPVPGGLDLISCRNLLIYMKSCLQDKLVKSFHKALKPRGLLFLGQYESLSFVGNALFVPLDQHNRLYYRRH